MKSGVFTKASLITFLLFFCALAVAQTSTGTLKGHVTDPSGAVVPKTSIEIRGAKGQKVTTTTKADGSYEFKDVAADKYTLNAAAEGFSKFESFVELGAGKVQSLDIELAIAVKSEAVNVQDDATDVNTDPTNNASSVVLKGKDLDALSDDPDELQSELEALAGPAAGPNGGQIYIDGFSNGQLPPKSSIREIRINQNPFSAQYDRLGFARIEILTKPGKDQTHGRFQFNLNNSALNSRNPYLTTRPDYHSEQYSGDISGPLNGRASYSFNFERRNDDEVSAINAVRLDSNLNRENVNTTLPNPGSRMNFSPRLDFQLTQNNTLNARYQFFRRRSENEGVGQFNLESQAYNREETEHMFQVSDTQMINATTVNETRFQVVRTRSQQLPLNFSPTISVLQAFTDGGNSSGRSDSHSERYEFQNYFSKVHGSHFLKLGGRLRAARDAENRISNANGTFTFTSLPAYETTLIGIRDNWTADQIRAAGGGASQFSITAGNPAVSASGIDLGAYFEDDWRVRPNLTVSYGVRFETQNNISDHADIAPRIGIAWGIGGSKNSAAKTVLRAGAGVFYDRFGVGSVLQTERVNGTNQQQYIVTNPDFYPVIPAISTLPTLLSQQPTVYRIGPNFESPYTIQTAVTLERQIGRSNRVSVSYINSRGVHTMLTRNANAPYPDTYKPDDPASGVRPFGDAGNIYQYESAGLYKQQQVMVNMNVRISSAISLFGNYAYGVSHGNTAGGFPTNQYDIAADWGRTGFDTRHRAGFFGTISMPYGINLSPFVMLSSGRPFNIVLGKDLNGDSVFNERPAFATSATLAANLRHTAWGDFDIAPVQGQARIPINYGESDGQFSMNLRVSKSFGFGKKREVAGAAQTPEGPGGPPMGGGPGPGGPGGGGMRGGGRHGGGGFPGFGGRSNSRYNLVLSASAHNLLNTWNPGTPIGNLSSPLFGEANQLSGGFGRGGGSNVANRRIDLSLSFNF